MFFHAESKNGNKKLSFLILLWKIWEFWLLSALNSRMEWEKFGSLYHFDTLLACSYDTLSDGYHGLW